MDGIQAYGGAPHPAYPAPHIPTGYPSPGHAVGYHQGQPSGGSGLPPKTPADYLRGIIRRVWLVLAVAITFTVAGVLVVLRMPAIYKVEAELKIEPPRFDRFLSGIIPGSFNQANNDELEKYVPDKLTILRSRTLADKVVYEMSRDEGVPINPMTDPAGEIVKNFSAKPRTGTHYHVATLEGTDPARITRTLTRMLDLFRQKVTTESIDSVSNSKIMAEQSLTALGNDITKLTTRIHDISQTSSYIAPGGINIPTQQLMGVEQQLNQKRMMYGELQRSLMLNANRPAPGTPAEEAKRGRLAKLEDEKSMLIERYNRAKSVTRDPTDPALRSIRDRYRRIGQEIAAVERPTNEPEKVDDSEVILASAQAEIEELKAERTRHLEEMKESLPKFDDYLDLVSQRNEKQKQKAETQRKLSEFDALAKMRDPVEITVPPVEPLLPDRPKRALLIAVIVVLGFLLGGGLAGGLEHLDQSVKVPEHLTLGLMLPLLGVVPRIRRTARLDRGGHLWTPGVPDSIEADAYRNLRASLLGVAGTHGPMVTLLVTSAKAGEGKSTTALNLAATCARAGERTLLVDVDLRRPTLADVFPHEEGHLGLVDVLRGDLPWQRVVVSTDLPNLDFIPTGDTRDVPIEILGSLELRQLLLSLSNHHYDRVILDGPAILGLADCRMLGRIVDAAVLVVRYGTRELRPLRRAKGVLEQSRVPLVGVIFNGLSDDLENWSSYGPGSTPFGTPGPEAQLPDLDAGGPAGLPVAPLVS
jgi:succinoglycan biosynthesis transport protein ExoP